MAPLGGYSFGGLDPQLMRQISDYVPESPYAASVRRDPSFGPAAAQYIGNLASPSMPSPDTAMGRPQPLLSDHGDDGPSGMEIVGGIMTAPFRALGLVKEGLEDALGHRNSRMRSAQDLQIEIATKLGLMTNALTQDQKAAIFPDQFAQDRAALDARSYSDGDGAMGRSTNGMPLPTPRKSGIWEWFTGQKRRQKEEGLARAAMVQHAIEQNIRAEQLRTIGAHGDLYRTQEEGARWGVEQGYKYGDLERMAGLGKDYAAIEASRANAAQSYAGADYSRAAIGNLGADNYRADLAEQRAQEKDSRDRVADMLALRGKREDIRQTKLENRGKVLDLRNREEEGPFGVDTGYDKLGRAFNLRQFTTAYNAADKKEKPGVIERYGIPTKESGGLGGFFTTTEPDYDRARVRPQPQASGTPPATSSSQQPALGDEPATKPETIPGQAPGQVDGQTLRILKAYDNNAEQIDQAFMDGILTEGAARKAIEALRYQRQR